ncbi:hypothetical protein CSU72_04500 [Salmonella enterica subsp. enterica serovar Infantis]|nr:hypothetical protein [Salmonella enterica subsp. enterica serovar Infantis]
MNCPAGYYFILDSLAKEILSVNTATFDVYVNDKKAGTFSPGLKNTQKELSDLSGCRTTHYSD